jgi:hypothetical protein
MLKLLLITLTSLLFTACGGSGSSPDPVTQLGPEKSIFQFDTPSAINFATVHQEFILEINYLGSANISIESLPSWANLNLQTPNKVVIQGTPDIQAAGRIYAGITLIADHNGEELRSQPFQIEVNPIDNPPIDNKPIIQTQVLEFIYELKSEFTAALDITDIDSVVKPENISLIGSSPYIEVSLSDDLKITITVSDMGKLLMATNNYIYVGITGEFGLISKNLPITFIADTALTAQSNFSGTINRDQELTVTFNQPIDQDELTTTMNATCEGNIQISSDNFDSCVPLYLVEDSQSLDTFDFTTEDLFLNVDYQLKTKSGITSLFQSTLAEDVISNFTLVSGLIITEISSARLFEDMNWFEIYNSSVSPIDLSTYSFNSRGIDRTSCVDNTCDVFHHASFNLPAQTIQPGQYMVVRAQHWDETYANTDRVIYIGEDVRPFWNDFGYIEIINPQSETSDFVIFGSWGNTPQPVPAIATEWSGSSATGLSASYNSPLKRNAALKDNNNSSDWSIGYVSTPAGPNDVECSTDNDQDGIPDCSEVEGSTFAGISLYQLGARVDQRDIFIEVDYMDSSDEGVIPRQEALQKVVDSFANKNIAVHFDVGDLFDQAEGINLTKFDLGGGNQVPFSAGIGIGIDIPVGDGLADLYDIKRAHFDFSRLPIFHYMLMANSQESDGSRDSSGLAEINANDFLISLGGWGLNSETDGDLNKLINLQASTIMHELGHNLGLRHGGYEERNNKPNYLSIMNYMYQLEGLPTIGENEGDRFYYQTDRKNGNNACGSNDNPMTNPFDGDYRNFIIDYSDGSSSTLDENAAIESDGLLRSGSAAIDFDCDGSISTTGLSRELNFDTHTTSLSDHNDWEMINLNFQRTRHGSINGIGPYNRQPNDLVLLPYSIANDKAEVAHETPPSQHFFNMIREQ